MADLIDGLELAASGLQVALSPVSSGLDVDSRSHHQLSQLRPRGCPKVRKSRATATMYTLTRPCSRSFTRSHCCLRCLLLQGLVPGAATVTALCHCLWC